MSSSREVPPRGSWWSVKAHARVLVGWRAPSLLGGEPATRARQRRIQASGRSSVRRPDGTSEMGSRSERSARAPKETDGVDLFQDGVLVVPGRGASASGETVDALLVTAFAPNCPKLMLMSRSETTVPSRNSACGCRLGELGYGRHLHSIGSSQKLTGEGAAIDVADPPGAGGGAPGASAALRPLSAPGGQTSGGLRRYVFHVSPEVGVIDERALVRVSREEVGPPAAAIPVSCSTSGRRATPSAFDVQRPAPDGPGKLASFRTLGPDDHA